MWLQYKIDICTLFIVLSVSYSQCKILVGEKLRKFYYIIIGQYFTKPNLAMSLTLFDSVVNNYFILPCIGMALIEFFQAMNTSLIC